MIDWYEATMEELADNHRNWCVSLAVTGWLNDTFCGTLEECIEYVHEKNYKIDGEEGKICLIDDEDGFCYDEYIEEE